MGMGKGSQKNGIVTGGFIFSPFNLTAAMFQETEKEKYSSVVVLVRADSRFTRFENLRSAKACIPEFGGIGRQDHRF